MADSEKNEKTLNELKEEAKEASVLLESAAAETRQAYTELAEEVQRSVTFLQELALTCKVSDGEAEEATEEVIIPEAERYQEDSQEKLNSLSEGLSTVSQAGMILTLPAAVAIAAPTLVLAPIGLAVSGGLLASALFFKDKKEKEERREAEEYLARSEIERQKYERQTGDIRRMKEELLAFRMLYEPSLVYFKNRECISTYDKEEIEMLLEARVQMKEKLQAINDYFLS